MSVNVTQLKKGGVEGPSLLFKLKENYMAIHSMLRIKKQCTIIKKINTISFFETLGFLDAEDVMKEYFQIYIYSSYTQSIKTHFKCDLIFYYS